jgi:small conductance mechanosensitive channel
MHPAVLLLQSAARPHSLRDWRLHGFDYLFDAAMDVAGVLLGALVAWLVIRAIATRIERWGEDGRTELRTAREQRARTSAKLFRHVARALLVVVTALLVLGQLGFNVSPLLASAGVVGLAVSFGSQSLVRDFVTGFFLQLEHQFALGDVIRIGTVEGTVENVTLRLVYLRDGRGALHIIPNGQILQVTNLTRAATQFGEDPAWADALLASPRLSGIESLGATTVTLRLVARVDPYRRDDVARELRRRVKAALDADKIARVAPPAPAPPIA